MEPADIIGNLLLPYNEKGRNASVTYPLVPLEIIKLCKKYAERFEPYRLSKEDKILRIQTKLSQRPSVNDIRMRGIVYEHPSIALVLVERKRNLMRRRASSKIDFFLQNRTIQKDLKTNNIYITDTDESQ